MIKILQPKRKGCDDPFFYDGAIAKGKKFYVAAVGDIRINCHKHDDRLCYDNKPRNCCCLDPKTDKDVQFGSDTDRPFWFDNNNWFEFLGIDQKDDPEIEVCFSYKEALLTLRDLEGR